MVEQVSRMACGGLSASRMRLLMNFLAWARSTCGLEDERDEVIVFVSVEFAALLAMSPGLVLAAETRDGLQEKGATNETSRYVTEPLRLKTKSMRACSR